MSRIMQFAFPVPSNEIDFTTPCIVETLCHPLYRPREMMQAVNQGGKIKIHMLVDESKPQRTERFLIIGTGKEVAGHLLNSIRSVGHLLMNDGQYGVHVYHIETHPEAGQEVPKKTKLTVEFQLADYGNAGDVSDLARYLNLFCVHHAGDVKSDLTSSGSGSAGPHKIHVLSNKFLDSHEFAGFKERMYQDPLVRALKFIKLS
jgi:hypothetical protein